MIFFLLDFISYRIYMHIIDPNQQSMNTAPCDDDDDLYPDDFCAPASLAEDYNNKQER